jgi:hypothetical protein
VPHIAFARFFISASSSPALISARNLTVGGTLDSGLVSRLTLGKISRTRLPGPKAPSKAPILSRVRGAHFSLEESFLEVFLAAPAFLAASAHRLRLGSVDEKAADAVFSSFCRGVSCLPKNAKMAAGAETV